MLFGSKPVDGGNLIMGEQEKDSLLVDYPESKAFLKKLIGADEYVKGYARWCLWIEDDQVDEAMNIPPLRERINNTSEFRLKSSKEATRKSAATSHKFGEIRFNSKPSIIVPCVGSIRREYLIAGFLDKNSVILDRAQAIPNATLFEFALIVSKLHLLWAGVICGRLKTDINYSSSLCYNNFPVPRISAKQKSAIMQSAAKVLEVRELYSSKTIADMYDPDDMPADLRSAHMELDKCVESLYGITSASTDDENLKCLFKLYEKMTGGQNA